MSKPDTVTLDKKPWVITLDKGVWASDLVDPPVKVKANGTDQPSPGHPTFDIVAVRVIGPDAVEVTTKKFGRVLFVRTLTVSADGKSMLQRWSDRNGLQPATGETVYERLSKGPAGSHAVSGSWKATKVQNMSANGMTVTYKATAGGIRMSAATGQRYEAKFDGKEYPFIGEANPGTVMVKQQGAHGFTETWKRGGKVVEIDRMSVSSDGKSMKVDWESPETHRSGSYEMTKQP